MNVTICLRNRWGLLVMVLGLLGQSGVAAPLSLHPDNPRYLQYRGRPTVLITSGEHYGAVLNQDFDYAKYLGALRKDGLNLTRTFTGVYAEPVGAFQIEKNTLAPAPGRLIAPWARSSVPGYAGGGNKFDLDRWDPAYFRRLKDFMAEARRQGVIVELNLFCPFYEENMWDLSPMNSRNNIQGVGTVGRTNVYTLDRSGGLLAVQEAVVRKLVVELNAFDNLYYEICNEPYFGGVTWEWQARVVDWIQSTESRLPKKHLISQNIANGAARVERPISGVSIFNFHYASPPDAVALNSHLNRVVGDNERGFKGTYDAHYRKEAWQFMLAGGGLFNHLDYSFAVGHEGGDFVFPKTQPGGGGATLRKQFGELRRFLEGLDFVRMKPDVSVVDGVKPAGMKVYALVEAGRQYALHLSGESLGMVHLRVPPGRYTLQWMDPVTGFRTARSVIRHGGDRLGLGCPGDWKEAALRLVRE